MNSLARHLCWFGVCPQEGNKRLLAELVRTQIKHTVYSICSSCAFPVWEPCWSQPWCHWCTFSPLTAHFAIFFTAPKKQRNWRGPGSVLSHSEWSNGITAETKVIHSLALMFVLKFLFKSWIILECIIRYLVAGFSDCSHGWKANGNLISQENHTCMRWL